MFSGCPGNFYQVFIRLVFGTKLHRILQFDHFVFCPVGLFHLLQKFFGHLFIFFDHFRQTADLHGISQRKQNRLQYCFCLFSLHCILFLFFFSCASCKPVLCRSLHYEITGSSFTMICISPNRSSCSIVIFPIFIISSTIKNVTMTSILLFCFSRSSRKEQYLCFNR